MLYSEEDAAADRDALAFALLAAQAASDYVHTVALAVGIPEREKAEVEERLEMVSRALCAQYKSRENALAAYALAVDVAPLTHYSDEFYETALTTLTASLTHLQFIVGDVSDEIFADAQRLLNTPISE